MRSFIRITSFTSLYSNRLFATRFAGCATKETVVMAPTTTTTSTTSPPQTLTQLTALLSKLLEWRTPLNELDKGAVKRIMNQLAQAIKSTAVEEETESAGVASIVNGLSAVGATADTVHILQFVENTLWRNGKNLSAAEVVLLARALLKLQNIAAVGVLGPMVWPCVRVLPSCNGAEVVSIARVFHAYGVRHPVLRTALLARAQELSESITVDELSRTILATSFDFTPGKTPENTSLMNTLCNKITKDIDLLGLGTIARCANILSRKDYSEALDAESLQSATALCLRRGMEITPISVLNETVEFARCMSKLVTTEQYQELLEPLSLRVTALKEQLNPSHIVHLLETLQHHSILNEKLFEILAERTCVVIHLIDVNEMATVIATLAHFDLYDGELFPLIANKIQQLTRMHVNIDIDTLTVILKGFAKVKEKNDNILYSAANQYKTALSKLSKPQLEEAIAAFEVFSFNHRDIVGQMKTRLASL